jgi:hypothetical protein
VAQNRHVILFMDGASVHNKLPHYSNIVTDSPPPNTTSATQSLDQGIIKVVKEAYRAKLVTYLLNEWQIAMS